MRKLFFLLVTFLSLQVAYGQSKIGIKVAPTLSTNRIEFTDPATGNYAVSTNGVGGRFIFGPIFDLLITDNYYFSTGLLYAPKRIGITVVNLDQTTSTPSDQVYNLQYIQLPATMKLFTNELAMDTRVYFQLGALLDVKVSSKTEETYTNPAPYIDNTRLFDFSIHLGSGVEYRLGYNTILFGGIFYNRGLINAVTKTLTSGPDIDVKNDLVGLELGVKF